MAMSGPGRAAAVVRGTGRHDSDDDFPGEVRERLARHLRGHGMRFDPAGSITRLAGGLANRNYRTMVDGRAVVLRRPPDGQLPPGAYDMAREHRILASLGTTRDTAVERIFRDVRAFRIYDGPSELHRWALGRRIMSGKI